MAARKPKIVSILQFANLAIFLASILTITALHTYTQNFLDFLRLPKFIYNINPLIGSGWPASLHVYQAVLIFSIFLSLTNATGLFLYRSKIWRVISDISSFLGFLIIWPVAIFFIYTLAAAENIKLIDFQTNVAYFIFTIFIFALDLITWYVDDQSFLKLKRN